MSNNYIFRKLCENDYEKYLKLINDFRETNFSKEAFVSILNKINNNNSSIWVIVIDDELIATGTIIYEPKIIHGCQNVGHIEDIVVQREYRSHGIASEIIQQLIADSKKNNCYKVTLDCHYSNIEFYEKNSFVHKGAQMAIYHNN